MFVNVEHDYGKRSPDAALVMRVGVVYPEAAFFRIPCENGPASRGHRALREILDEALDGSIAFNKRIGQLARVFELAVAAENFEIPFVQVDSVDGVGLAVFKAAQFAIGCISAVGFTGNDRAA